MKLQNPVPQKIHLPHHWHSTQLPIGLKAATVKSTSTAIDISLPDTGEEGLTLTFIQYKGDVSIRQVCHKGKEWQPGSPGMGLMSTTGRPLEFRSAGPVQFAGLSLTIPGHWARLFLGENEQVTKIEQLLESEGNIITSRLGRRQLSLLSSAMAEMEGERGDLLRMQNDVMGLLEHFLCNRHRSLLGVSPGSDIENEDDLSLIREVESYISEYYCSDTFTVDAILKKTYTSYHRLNFLFKSIHGMTISEYIRNKRIEKSKEMIADNAKSISQIAYEIGYSSISNYILAFKKVYQITPGKYKKQMGA